MVLQKRYAVCVGIAAIISLILLYAIIDEASMLSEAVYTKAAFSKLTPFLRRNQMAGYHVKVVKDKVISAVRENTQQTTKFNTAENEDQLERKKIDSHSKEIYDFPAMRERAENNRIIVTWGNYHYLDFILNWSWHFDKIGVKNYIVGAMDSKIYDALIERGIPCFAMNSNLSTTDFGWGTPQFHLMGREKIRLIGAVTGAGLDLLLTDVDAVFLRDPNPYIDQYPEVDILISSDHLRMTNNGDGGLEDYSHAGSPANIGIMHFSHRSHIFGIEWLKQLEENPNAWDQQLFNNMMRQGLDRHEIEINVKKDPPDRSFMGYNGKFRFGILPVSLFCSGHTFFVQNMPSILNETAYAVHATFQFGGTEGKRHRLREALMWNDEPSYFSSKSSKKDGFLHIKYEIPQDLLDIGSFSREGHFALVNYQLRHIRSGIALSKILNRILIMPKMYCMYDRFWFVFTNGRNQNADGPSVGPFVCPLDHVFTNLNQMEQYIEFREYSFLSNPRLQKLPMSRQLLIQVGTNSNGSSSQINHTLEDNILKVEGDVSESGILELIEPYKDRELLVFESVADIFKLTFDNLSDYNMFEFKAKRFVGLWCCDQPPPGKPGHIHYDMFFDIIPHTDAQNRKWNRTNAGDVFGP